MEAPYVGCPGSLWCFYNFWAAFEPLLFKDVKHPGPRLQERTLSGVSMSLFDRGRLSRWGSVGWLPTHWPGHLWPTEGTLGLWCFDVRHVPALVADHLRRSARLEARRRVTGHAVDFDRADDRAGTGEDGTCRSLPCPSLRATGFRRGGWWIRCCFPYLHRLCDLPVESGWAGGHHPGESVRGFRRLN